MGRQHVDALGHHGGGNVRIRGEGLGFTPGPWQVEPTQDAQQEACVIRIGGTQATCLLDLDQGQFGLAELVERRGAQGREIPGRQGAHLFSRRQELECRQQLKDTPLFIARTPTFLMQAQEFGPGDLEVADVILVQGDERVPIGYPDQP